MKNDYNYAAIFKRTYKEIKDSSLVFDSVALVNYDDKMDKFDIVSGELAGASSNDLTILGGEPNRFFEPGSMVTLKRLNTFSDRFIYVFSKAFVSEVAHSKKLTTTNTQVALTKILARTSLINSTVPGTYMIGTADGKRITIDQIKSMLAPVEIKKKEERNILSIDVNELIKEISERIVGQEDAIRCLVANIYNNQLLIDKILKNYDYEDAELDSRKVTILLDGPTGTGKTAILKEIARKLDVPIVIRSANSFSETGYVGPSITSLLKKLYIMAGRDINKAERGIVVLDEVDKISTKGEVSGKDMKKGVQEELLGFISGNEYEVPYEDNANGGGRTVRFDTSKLTFIFSGAWTELKDKKIREKEKKYKQTGFVSAREIPEEDKCYTVTSQDYIDEGLEREFFGRIKVLAYTKAYNKDDLKNILFNSKISPLKNLEKTVQMYGYPGIICDEEFIDKLCDMALENGTGARGLQSIMHSIQDIILLRLINHDYDLKEKIVLDDSLLRQYTLSRIRRY